MDGFSILLDMKEFISVIYLLTCFVLVTMLFLVTI